MSKSTATFEEKGEPTLGGGNCAFNAFILGLRRIAEKNADKEAAVQGTKPRYNDAFLQAFHATVPGKAATWKDFNTYLLGTDTTVLQTTLHDMFRKFAITLIKAKNAGGGIQAQEHAARSFNPLLKTAFDNYVKRRKGQPAREEDDVFANIDFVQNKFKELYEAKSSNLESLSGNELERAITTIQNSREFQDWWFENGDDQQGYTRFLDYMNKPSHWAGDLELAPLAEFFGVNLAIRKKHQTKDQIPHFNYGALNTTTLALQQNTIEALKDFELIDRTETQPGSKIYPWLNVTEEQLRSLLHPIPDAKDVQTHIDDTLPEKIFSGTKIETTFLPKTIHDELVTNGIIRAQGGFFVFVHATPDLTTASDGYTRLSTQAKESLLHAMTRHSDPLQYTIVPQFSDACLAALADRKIIAVKSIGGHQQYVFIVDKTTALRRMYAAGDKADAIIADWRSSPRHKETVRLKHNGTDHWENLTGVTPQKKADPDAVLVELRKLKNQFEGLISHIKNSLDRLGKNQKIDAEAYREESDKLIKQLTDTAKPLLLSSSSATKETQDKISNLIKAANKLTTVAGRMHALAGMLAETEEKASGTDKSSAKAAFAKYFREQQPQINNAITLAEAELEKIFPAASEAKKPEEKTAASSAASTPSGTGSLTTPQAWSNFYTSIRDVTPEERILKNGYAYDRYTDVVAQISTTSLPGSIPIASIKHGDKTHELTEGPRALYPEHAKRFLEGNFFNPEDKSNDYVVLVLGNPLQGRHFTYTTKEGKIVPSEKGFLNYFQATPDRDPAKDSRQDADIRKKLGFTFAYEAEEKTSGLITKCPMTITRDTTTKRVTVFHLKQFPDFGTAALGLEDVKALLELQKINKLKIHCSAGLGRTGALEFAFILHDQTVYSRCFPGGDADLAAITVELEKLRVTRPGLIQTAEQLNMALLLAMQMRFVDRNNSATLQSFAAATQEFKTKLDRKVLAFTAPTGTKQSLLHGQTLPRTTEEATALVEQAFQQAKSSIRPDIGDAAATIAFDIIKAGLIEKATYIRDSHTADIMKKVILSAFNAITPKAVAQVLTPPLDQPTVNAFHQRIVSAIQDAANTQRLNYAKQVLKLVVDSSSIDNLFNTGVHEKLKNTLSEDKILCDVLEQKENSSVLAELISLNSNLNNNPDIAAESFATGLKEILEVKGDITPRLLQTKLPGVSAASLPSNLMVLIANLNSYKTEREARKNIADNAAKEAYAKQVLENVIANDGALPLHAAIKPAPGEEKILPSELAKHKSALTTLIKLNTGLPSKDAITGARLFATGLNSMLEAKENIDEASLKRVFPGLPADFSVSGDVATLISDLNQYKASRDARKTVADAFRMIPTPPHASDEYKDFDINKYKDAFVQLITGRDQISAAELKTEIMNIIAPLDDDTADQVKKELIPKLNNIATANPIPPADGTKLDAFANDIAVRNAQAAAASAANTLASTTAEMTNNLQKAKNIVALIMAEANLYYKNKLNISTKLVLQPSLMHLVAIANAKSEKEISDAFLEILTPAKQHRSINEVRIALQTKLGIVIPEPPTVGEETAPFLQKIVDLNEQAAEATATDYIERRISTLTDNLAKKLSPDYRNQFEISLNSVFAPVKILLIDATMRSDKLTSYPQRVFDGLEKYDPEQKMQSSEVINALSALNVVGSLPNEVVAFNNFIGSTIQNANVAAVIAKIATTSFAIDGYDVSQFLNSNKVLLENIIRENPTLDAATILTALQSVLKPNLQESNAANIATLLNALHAKTALTKDSLFVIAIYKANETAANNKAVQLVDQLFADYQADPKKLLSKDDYSNDYLEDKNTPTDINIALNSIKQGLIEYAAKNTLTRDNIDNVVREQFNNPDKIETALNLAAGGGDIFKNTVKNDIPAHNVAIVLAGITKDAIYAQLTNSALYSADTIDKMLIKHKDSLQVFLENNPTLTSAQLIAGFKEALHDENNLAQSKTKFIDALQRSIGATPKINNVFDDSFFKSLENLNIEARVNHAITEAIAQLKTNILSTDFTSTPVADLESRAFNLIKLLLTQKAQAYPSDAPHTNVNDLKNELIERFTTNIATDFTIDAFHTAVTAIKNENIDAVYDALKINITTTPPSPGYAKLKDIVENHPDALKAIIKAKPNLTAAEIRTALNGILKLDQDKDQLRADLLKGLPGGAVTVSTAPPDPLAAFVTALHGLNTKALRPAMEARVKSAITEAAKEFRKSLSLDFHSSLDDKAIATQMLLSSIEVKLVDNAALNHTKEPFKTPTGVQDLLVRLAKPPLNSATIATDLQTLGIAEAEAKPIAAAIATTIPAANTTAVETALKATKTALDTGIKALLPPGVTTYDSLAEKLIGTGYAAYEAFFKEIIKANPTLTGDMLKSTLIKALSNTSDEYKDAAAYNEVKTQLAPPITTWPTADITPLLKELFDSHNAAVKAIGDVSTQLINKIEAGVGVAPNAPAYRNIKTELETHKKAFIELYKKHCPPMTMDDLANKIIAAIKVEEKTNTGAGDILAILTPTLTTTSRAAATYDPASNTAALFTYLNDRTKEANDQIAAAKKTIEDAISHVKTTLAPGGGHSYRINDEYKAQLPSALDDRVFTTAIKEKLEAHALQNSAFDFKTKLLKIFEEAVKRPLVEASVRAAITDCGIAIGPQQDAIYTATTKTILEKNANAAIKDIHQKISEKVSLDVSRPPVLQTYQYAGIEAALNDPKVKEELQKALIEDPTLTKDILITEILKVFDPTKHDNLVAGRVADALKIALPNINKLDYTSEAISTLNKNAVKKVLLNEAIDILGKTISKKYEYDVTKLLSKHPRALQELLISPAIGGDPKKLAAFLGTVLDPSLSQANVVAKFKAVLPATFTTPKMKKLTGTISTLNFAEQQRISRIVSPIANHLISSRRLGTIHRMLEDNLNIIRHFQNSKTHRDNVTEIDAVLKEKFHIAKEDYYKQFSHYEPILKALQKELQGKIDLSGRLRGDLTHIEASLALLAELDKIMSEIESSNPQKTQTFGGTVSSCASSDSTYQTFRQSLDDLVTNGPIGAPSTTKMTTNEDKISSAKDTTIREGETRVSALNTNNHVNAWWEESYENKVPTSELKYVEEKISISAILCNAAQVAELNSLFPATYPSGKTKEQVLTELFDNYIKSLHGSAIDKESLAFFLNKNQHLFLFSHSYIGYSHNAEWLAGKLMDTYKEKTEISYFSTSTVRMTVGSFYLPRPKATYSFPKPEFIQLAHKQMASLFNTFGKGGDVPTLTLKSSFDPHYTQACVLLAKALGWKCYNQTGHVVKEPSSARLKAFVEYCGEQGFTLGNISKPIPEVLQQSLTTLNNLRK